MNDKFKSRKFIFAVWGAISFSAFGIISLIKESTPSWMSIAMPALVSIVVSYVTIGRLKEPQKKK